jgi:GNAT superfamily N-acetyltransferase
MCGRDEFEVLTSAAAASWFHHMTFPAYQHLLAFEGSRPVPFALAVRSAGRPAALALAAPVSADSAQLLSVFVEKEARHRGLATELVERTATECASRGFIRLTATYMLEASQIGTAPVEIIFARNGWSNPERRMLVVHCSIESVRNAAWMKRRQLPAGHEIVSWVDVTSVEREEIQQSNARAPWIPPDLVPFKHETNLEPVTSVALRLNGQVLGWCLNHGVGDKLRFTCSFVRDDLQGRGRVFSLYQEAVARAPRAGFSVGMWTVPVWHARMVQFAERHMRPYSLFFGETRGVEKRL